MLSFTAVGDDWQCGTAAGYQLFTSASPIVQGNVAHAEAIAVTQTPSAAGTAETITIPASLDKGFLAIRAVDHAGNIGPIAVRTTLMAQVHQSGFGAGAGLLPLAGMAVGAAVVSRRRRLGRS